MYSLFIDTHFLDVVIGLYKDGELLTINDTCNLKHSTITMPMIKEILNENNLDIQDIKEIICVNGPGSFTGVRIGVTISKMLGITLGIKIKVIDFLYMMALFTGKEDKWVSIVDKNGAFIGHFDAENEPIDSYKYYNKTDYNILKEKYEIVEEIKIDYKLLYKKLTNLKFVDPHLVNPIYVKNVVV